MLARYTYLYIDPAPRNSASVSRRGVATVSKTVIGSSVSHQAEEDQIASGRQGPLRCGMPRVE